MAADEQTPAREILLLGAYGVLGTGVVDAVAANPAAPGHGRPPPGTGLSRPRRGEAQWDSMVVR